VPWNRLLKILNISIAVAVLAALVAVYWIAYRPLPVTSGSLNLPISQPARVVRDSLGVPHIEAASTEDAYFLQGYVTAQDRLWQMDTIRRFAAGELAEIFGQRGLELDRDARRFRLRRIAEQHSKALAPQDRAVLAAYARGVNSFIEECRKRPALEFTLLGYDPRPWSITDTVLAGLEMFRSLTGSWRDEIQKNTLLAGGDRAKVEFLFATRTGAEVQPGSNAWVLAGSRTATGRPLLANDPHLEFSVPSRWYMVHLKAPGLNVSGVSLPGIPAVIIGHNERIAWGATNLHFDVQDTYIERLDIQMGRHVFRGQVEQARPEREIIQVKGARPVTIASWVTRHGPLLMSEGGVNLTLRWAASEAGQFDFPFVELNRARNWAEFRGALSRFPGPAQNFVYADADGNIGYQVAGRLPIRKSFAGDLPVDGSSGTFEWEGWIPFNQLPSVFNPPSGMVVTANQNPFPADYPYRVNGNFATPHRARQIQLLLEKRAGWRPEEMLAIQKDVYSALFHFLGREAVAAYGRRGAKGDATVATAARLLGEWNGQMDQNLAAPMVASLLYDHLRRMIADRASPGKGLAWDFVGAPAVVEKLLRERPRDWFPDYDQVLLTALTDAVEEGARIQGRRPDRWRYGKYHEVTITHPVAGRVPWVGKYFNFGPVEMSGSSLTVKQTTLRLGPSMRMVLDLSDWDRSLQNILTGQSGHVLSKHYGDQWDEYYVGRSLPMQFNRVEPKGVLDVKPR
jgi:penicillin amidase